MSTKLVLNNVANLQSESTAVQTLNDNFAKIAAAFDNTFSRDGTTPNYLQAALDMQSQRMINLPAPVSASEPLRLGDIGGIAPSDIANAGTFAAQASASAAAAAASALAASSYVGAATNAPKWTTARTITLFGDITGTSPTWDGSTDLNFTGISILAGAVDSTKLASGAAAANLGFTPLNSAGGTLTGDVVLNFVGSGVQSNSIGFRGVPIHTVDSADYTFVVDDTGKLVRHTDGTARLYWIDSNGTTPYPVGAAIGVRNVGTGSVTIKRGPGVSLRKAGSGTDADVVVAQWGLATLVQEASNVWLVSGMGIS